MSRTMRAEWSKERPTTAGWYWWRKEHGYTKIMAAVFLYEPTGILSARFHGLAMDLGTLPMDAIGGEWQPVQPPRE